MTLPLLRTTVIGSLPKPAWLTDAWYTVPERWHLEGAALAEAQDDATRLALLDQLDAGIDIVCDGEQRRSTHYTYFLRGLDGVDGARLAPKSMRAGKFTQDVPRVVGALRLRAHLTVDDYRFLRRLTTRPIKMTLPGPSTLVDGTVDEHYGDERALAFAYADVLNAEIRALGNAGCAKVQLDEPVFTRIPWKLADWGVEAMDRAFASTTVTSVVHVCYGYGARLGTKEWKHGYDEILPHLARARNVQQYSLEFAEPGLSPALLAALGDKTVQLGVIDCGRDEVESADTVAARLRAALDVVPARRLVAAPARRPRPGLRSCEASRPRRGRRSHSPGALIDSCPLASVLPPKRSGHAGRLGEAPDVRHTGARDPDSRHRDVSGHPHHAAPGGAP